MSEDQNIYAVHFLNRISGSLIFTKSDKKIYKVIFQMNFIFRMIKFFFKFKDSSGSLK